MFHFLKPTVMHRTVHDVIRHYPTYVTTMLGILFGAFIITLIGQLSMGVVNTLIPRMNLATFPLLALIAVLRLVAYSVGIIAITYITGLLTMASLSNKGFRAHLRIVHSRFVDLLFLNVIFIILGVLTFTPLLGISVVMFFQPTLSTLIASLLLALFCILTIMGALWFVLTPYVMLDKKLDIVATLKKTFQIVSQKEWFMLKRLAIAFVLLVAVQILNVGSALISIYFSFLVSLSFLFFVVPFFYSYFKATYEDLA